MQLAFYAPMKAPDHPVPSGDRTIARSLIAALSNTGAKVSLASTLRCRDGQGDDTLQRQILKKAKAETERLIWVGRSENWQAWITYHNYYKAPDLIGPAVCRALGIPYLQVESTRARKRLDGPWARFAKAAEAATDAADVVFYFTHRDAESLREYGQENQQLAHLRPFLTSTPRPFAARADGPILSVGMLRHGDKLASYQLIAQTLAELPHDDWQLEIAGDGPARKQIETLMAAFGSKVRFLGQLEKDALQDAYARASLLFWPGVDEALGLVYLEAQASGLPVVAQDRPGMRDVLAPFSYPRTADGPAGLANLLEALLTDPAARNRQGRAAHDYVCEHHLMASAEETLKNGLAHVGVRP